MSGIQYEVLTRDALLSALRGGSCGDLLEDAADAAADEIERLQMLLAEADALLRPCPHCGMALALCYDAKRTGAIACCPDCRHDAHLAREEKP
jgi:predicted RNA-binding Zn-ribbon protein involved in translation (DUF1610 family)